MVVKRMGLKLFRQKLLAIITNDNASDEVKRRVNLKLDLLANKKSGWVYRCDFIYNEDPAQVEAVMAGHVKEFEVKYNEVQYLSHGKARGFIYVNGIKREASVKVSKTQCASIYKEAVKAGQAALRACVPAPIIIREGQGAK